MSSTFKDTTLRSVIFGKPDVAISKNASGKMTLTDKVDQATFSKYDHVLKIMAQFSRAIYCDSGIIRELLVSPEFATSDNVSVNNKITTLDTKYKDLRKLASTLAGSIDGRPMQSYVINESAGSGKHLARYISSPSDLTLMFTKGSALSAKCDFFKATDIILTFKGSSTMQNFKHDLYSQFTAADLKSIMPPGTKMVSSADKKNIVPASFIKPILESWDLLKQGLNEFKPQRLFVTGHSLGGAYASLFTFIMAEIREANFPFIQSIHNVTFGAPTILGDGARNTFNAHLDGGKVTLDRVTCVGLYSKLADLIPSIPVGFSHPGYQPLKTEMWPEARTGRAYTYPETVRQVFQKGGLFGLGGEKTAYEGVTKTRMPNRLVIPAKTKLVQGFTHAEYFDMTFLGAFRLMGMKNPGLKAKDGKFYTFVGDMFDDGVKFRYAEVGATAVSEEPVSATPSTPDELIAGTPVTNASKNDPTSPQPNPSAATPKNDPSTPGADTPKVGGTRRRMKRRRNTRVRRH